MTIFFSSIKDSAEEWEEVGGKSVEGDKKVQEIETMLPKKDKETHSTNAPVEVISLNYLIPYLKIIVFLELTLSSQICLVLFCNICNTMMEWNDNDLRELFC